MHTLQSVTFLTPQSPMVEDKKCYYMFNLKYVPSNYHRDSCNPVISLPRHLYTSHTWLWNTLKFPSEALKWSSPSDIDCCVDNSQLLAPAFLITPNTRSNQSYCVTHPVAVLCNSIPTTADISLKVINYVFKQNQYLSV